MKPEEFKQKRIELGFKTKSSIAAEIGVTEGAVKRWENGKSPVPLYAIRFLQRIKAKR